MANSRTIPAIVMAVVAFLPVRSVAAPPEGGILVEQSAADEGMLFGLSQNLFRAQHGLRKQNVDAIDSFSWLLKIGEERKAGLDTGRPVWSGTSASEQRAAARWTIRRGGRIYFVLEGMDPERFNSAPRPGGSWNFGPGTMDAMSYTNWELKQLLRNSAWHEHITFVDAKGKALSQTDLEGLLGPFLDRYPRARANFLGTRTIGVTATTETSVGAAAEEPPFGLVLIPAAVAYNLVPETTKDAASRSKDPFLPGLVGLGDLFLSDHFDIINTHKTSRMRRLFGYEYDEHLSALSSARADGPTAVPYSRDYQIVQPAWGGEGPSPQFLARQRSHEEIEMRAKSRALQAQLDSPAWIWAQALNPLRWTFFGRTPIP